MNQVHRHAPRLIITQEPAQSSVSQFRRGLRFAVLLEVGGPACQLDQPDSQVEFKVGKTHLKLGIGLVVQGQSA
ncbi:hypothetical protein TU79_10005 [Pseudomonas trivialis]|uniref:Uncharacterized protein n=1 Tax=Pseudomonas trivialis TaxID=200450 RepID=A0A0R2ZL28_9PSED|nr:hypothetical protein TU79_10005 [Pseudomonas trivialis]